MDHPCCTNCLHDHPWDLVSACDEGHLFCVRCASRPACCCSLPLGNIANWQVRLLCQLATERGTLFLCPACDYTACGPDMQEHRQKHHPDGLQVPIPILNAPTRMDAPVPILNAPNRVPVPVLSGPNRVGAPGPVLSGPNRVPGPVLSGPTPAATQGGDACPVHPCGQTVARGFMLEHIHHRHPYVINPDYLYWGTHYESRIIFMENGHVTGTLTTERLPRKSRDDNRYMHARWSSKSSARLRIYNGVGAGEQTTTLEPNTEAPGARICFGSYQRRVRLAVLFS